INEEQFITQSRDWINKFEKQSKGKELNITQHVIMENIENAIEAAQSPLQKLEHSLHPVVSFIIMPIFALANAGVVISNDLSIINPVSLGIILGLFLGKQIGIVSFTYFAVKSGLAELPQNISMRQIWGASILAGIGFTMSLFITELAFKEETLLTLAKLGVLIASLISGIVGYVFLRYFSKPEKKE